MMRRLKPLNDFIFKKLFGQKGNEDILISFLNAILKRTNKEPITEIEIIDNKELTKELLEDKTGIIDVRAKTSRGEEIDIEVQLTDQGNMEKRTLFYWSKLYIDNIGHGDDYRKLSKVIAINIVDFDFLETKGYHSSFHLWEDIDKNYMLTDMVEIHFIEMTKFRRKQNKDFKENVVERWLAFLEKDIPETTLKELMRMEPAIEKAEKKLEYLSSDKETLSIYWERERALHERANMINTAEERGFNKGIEQGIEKGKMQVAISLLDLLDDETIAAKTGLDLDTVKKLRDDFIK